MDRERVDRWCEHGILALVVGILAFGPLATGAVRTLEFLILQALTLGVMGLWLARLWLQHEPKLLWPPVCWGAVVFAGYAFWRYWGAELEYPAREELIRILLYSFLFFAVLNNVQRAESVNLVVYVLLGIATAAALYAVYQFVTGSNMVWHFVRPDQYDNRGSGTYICPNHLAGFLEMILPLGLAYTLMGRVGHVARILMAYASAACLAGIAVSISRGGWIATGLALLLFFLVLLRMRDYWIPALAALLLLVAGAVVFVAKAEISRERFREMFVAGKLENIRFRLWQPAIEIWKEDVWLGAGPAHFDYKFRRYRPEDVQMRPNRVHNDFLNTLADFGVVGLALVLAGAGCVAWGAVKTWKYALRSSDLGNRKSNRSAFVLGSATGLIAIVLHSGVDFNMHIPANAILAVTLMALLTAHWRFATERFWFERAAVIRIGGTLVLGVGMIYLAERGVLRAREFVPLAETGRIEEDLQWLTKRLDTMADRPSEQTSARNRIIELSRTQLGLLKQAFAIDPKNFETAYRIGETLRTESWQGRAGYQALAKEAIQWFDRAIALNPYDGYAYLRRGMCLDWLGQVKDAEPWYAKAAALDPNGYYTTAHLGWHAIYLDDYEKAREYFARSLKLKPHEEEDDNPIAAKYLAIVERRLQERAASDGLLPIVRP